MQYPPHDPEQTTTADAASLLGRRVGPYQLESELGRGGMGSVWLARRDDGYYDAKVAIKLLVLSWFGTTGVARFRHEGKLLARLDHPNIARLLDAGITDLGEPYLVLEYIEGVRIDAYCANARLGLRARLELFIGLLNAVAHAHRNLIVHRDIKPANVLVTPAGQAKLLDFGIGKLVQDDDDLTSTGQRILTPQFAAPEQLLGEPVTTATDIYGLGLLLYVLLTGQLPHAGSPAELIRRITAGDMPAPSSVELTRVRLGADNHVAPMPPEITDSLRRELRGDLDNIVLKALQASPSERYEDVAAFAADLRRYLRREPISARPSTLAYRASKFIQRNRTAVIATVLVVLAVTVGSVTTISQTLEARRQRAQAEYQARSAHLISDFFSLSLFSEGGPDRPALTMMERIERGVKLVESQYGNDPSFAGDMLLQMAARVGASGDLPSLIRLHERARELGRQAGDTDLMAMSECSLILNLAQSGQLGAIRQRMQEAQRLLARAPRPQFETRMTCLVAQAKIEQVLANRELAVTLLQQAEALVEKEQATFRPIHNVVLSMLCSVYIDQSKFAAALAATQRAAGLEEKFGRADTSEYLTTRQNAATLLLLMGEVAQSMTDREQINQLMRKYSSAEEVPLTYDINEAILMIRLGRAPAALELVTASIGRARASGNPAMQLQLLNLQALAAVETHDLNRVDSALLELQSLLDKGFGQAGIRSQVELRRAQLALARQDPLAARQHGDQALKLAGYGKPSAERSLSRLLLSVAEIALATDRRADAEQFARDSLRLCEAVARKPDSSADVGEALLLLVKSRSDRPSTELRPLLQRAVRCLANGLGADHRLTAEARTLLEAMRA